MSASIHQGNCQIEFDIWVKVECYGYILTMLTECNHMVKKKYTMHIAQYYILSTHSIQNFTQMTLSIFVMLCHEQLV